MALEGDRHWPIIRQAVISLRAGRARPNCDPFEPKGRKSKLVHEIRHAIAD
jgi:hypothetical protein